MRSGATRDRSARGIDGPGGTCPLVPCPGLGRTRMRHARPRTARAGRGRRHAAPGAPPGGTSGQPQQLAAGGLQLTQAAQRAPRQRRRQQDGAAREAAYAALVADLALLRGPVDTTDDARTITR